MGRKPKPKLTPEQQERAEKIALVAKYQMAVIYGNIYKSIKEQIDKGVHQVEVDTEKATENEKEDIYYTLIWGHTRAGSEAGLLDKEKPIERDDCDFTTYNLKEDLTSTDKRYLSQLIEQELYDVKWLKAQIDEKISQEEFAEYSEHAVKLRWS